MKLDQLYNSSATLLGLASLGPEARGSRGTVEVLGQHGGKEGVEDDLSTTSSR
ncbi:hypothetical protein CH063_06970 [Colletotrichum higginsianum]|uniref:Uncharacterized protein n=1 Tax=Colletotrichum higginsianum (strain IMI 349063) TaxID=759273 RepID=H1V4G4_COLHI|nr:hypothetical protein CH063_06970 [Colletotrichum higginsianum]